MKHPIFLISFVLVSANSQAIDCSYTEVTAIQAQTHSTLVQVKVSASAKPWKNLGSVESKHLAHFQSLAQQAMATNSSITMRFPESHDCNTTDYNTSTSIFRLNK